MGPTYKGIERKGRDNEGRTGHEGEEGTGTATGVPHLF